MKENLPSPAARGAALVLGALLAAAGSLGGCASPLAIESQRAPGVARIPQTRTVLFVHGMFMTPLCWADWEKLFQARGFTTIAPAWPEHDAPIDEQRRAHPSKKLGKLTLADVLDLYRAEIRRLPEPPILIGHSMGGLIVQLLLQEGLGAAGVAVDSAPPKGLISLRYSFFKSNWPVISPSARIDEPIHMGLDAFSYAFANTRPRAEQEAAYQRLIVPESRRIGKGPTTDAARIEFERARAPLLLIAGSGDHIIPASLNRSNYGRYEKAPAITDFREFPGRDHLLIAEPGWQELADYILGWLEKNRV
jgi:pimeloyl-ACP methyl ester carboxylesterase